MGRNALVIGAALLWAALSGCAIQAPFAIPTTSAEEQSESACAGGTLTPRQVLTLIQPAHDDDRAGVVLIDTRIEPEYLSGHIPGAVHIASQERTFWEQIRELPREQTYVICCRSGTSSRAVVAQMRRDGFENVCDISGGFLRWQREGLPVEKGAA